MHLHTRIACLWKNSILSHFSLNLSVVGCILDVIISIDFQFYQLGSTVINNYAN